MMAPSLFSVVAAAAIAAGSVSAQTEVLADRIDHTDPAEFTWRPSVHAGAGPMNYMRLTNTPRVLDGDLSFISRGLITPGGGIGHHFHHTSEEMFIIFDGEAEFTINGRTARVQGPAGAPNILGYSHAIVNPTNEPVEWMNIAVRVGGGPGGSIDLGDPRVDVPLDPIPPFVVMRLDREMLEAVNGMNGGKGTVQYRRALHPSIFRSTWAYVDHLLLPPGASVGTHVHVGVGEFFYVMSGEGVVTVSGPGGPESTPVRRGDAVPVRIGEPHSVVNEDGEPLELMVVGIAANMSKNLDTVDLPDQE